MSRRKKETLSRRDFLKATGIMAGSVLLSACSEYIQEIPTPTLTVSPTATKTLTPIPTQTPEPTSTSTSTSTPTPKPKPFEVRYSVEGAGGMEFSLPHINIEGLGEVIDFSDVQKLPRLPSFDHIPQWHEVLKKVEKSPGVLLAGPFSENVELPEWRFAFPDDLNKQQGLSIHFPRTSYDRQPLRIIAGFRIPYPTINESNNMWLVGVTHQICKPSNPTESLLVTGVMDAGHLSVWQPLNYNIAYLIPRIGIPLDIATNEVSASMNTDWYIAHYLSKVHAFNSSEYLHKVVQWDKDDYPSAYFSRNVYIGSRVSLSNQIYE